MHNLQVRALLLQSLEQERCGIRVYETALQCVLNADLRKGWERYVIETREHERMLAETCQVIRLDEETETCGRAVVRLFAKSMIQAMELALHTGSPEAAELVACECVVLAETRGHANWELIGQCAEQLPGSAAMAFKQAFGQVAPQADEHLYHSKSWHRALWLKSLGISTFLPPVSAQPEHQIYSAR